MMTIQQNSLLQLNDILIVYCTIHSTVFFVRGKLSHHGSHKYIRSIQSHSTSYNQWYLWYYMPWIYNCFNPSSSVSIWNWQMSDQQDHQDTCNISSQCIYHILFLSMYRIIHPNYIHIADQVSFHIDIFIQSLIYIFTNYQLFILVHWSSFLLFDLYKSIISLF